MLECWIIPGLDEGREGTRSVASYYGMEVVSCDLKRFWGWEEVERGGGWRMEEEGEQTRIIGAGETQNIPYDEAAGMKMRNIGMNIFERWVSFIFFGFW